MVKKIINEEFRRMQKLAGLKEAFEEEEIEDNSERDELIKKYDLNPRSKSLAADIKAAINREKMGKWEKRQEKPFEPGDKYQAGDLVTYNGKVYMILSINPDDTLSISLSNRSLAPRKKGDEPTNLDVKTSDVEKFTGKLKDIPLQKEAIEDDGEDGEATVVRRFKFGSGSYDKIILELWSDGSVEIKEGPDYYMSFTKEEARDLFEILKRIMN